MSRHSNQAGFSAIELLITLFVAAAFIGAGYQLFSVITKNGGDTQRRTKANNIAYNQLRQYADQATAMCTASTPSATVPTDSGLPNASISVNITCPYGTSAKTSKVQVSIKYGTPQQEVIHAIYVNGS